MPRKRTVTVTFSRETEDLQEVTYYVKCEVTAGRPATRLDPEEDPEVEILEIRGAGYPLCEDDLTSAEKARIEEGACQRAAEDDMDYYEEDR